LTLETESAGAFEIETVLPRRQLVGETEWTGDERVPLSLTPSGPPVAYLDTRAESDDSKERAIVIEKRRATRRVLYEIEHGVVMGWVPAAALRSIEAGVEAAWGLLFLGDPNAPTAPFGADDPTRLPELGEPEPSTPLPCAWNAPLTVEASGTRRQVGVIASGIPLVLGAEQDGQREVMFEHPRVGWHPTARFWVPEHLLYPCVGSSGG
jgi:hypothetical protein